MIDLMGRVDPAEWDLSSMQDRARAGRLSAAPSAEHLVSVVVQEATEAATTGRCTLSWQEGDQMRNCGRAIAVFPIGSDTFDALFNGCSGYRAQYYLSCGEGVRFNRVLVAALAVAAFDVHKLAPLKRGWELVRHSLIGPWSKIWVHRDGDPFNVAPEGEFRPKRWAESHPQSIGLRAPLPEFPAIDFMGTWVSGADRSYRQDQEWKSDRDQRLSECGFP